jgi:hypothetical protein
MGRERAAAEAEFRPLRTMTDFLQDVRYAFRTFGEPPA